MELQNDRIVIQLSIVDHVNYDTPPPKFVYGITNLTATVNFILNGNSTYIEMETIIKNPQTWPVNYEFWICETLTPGSTPGKSRSPLNSEIILGGVTQTKVRDDEWPWMATIETPIDPANHIYHFHNLKTFGNWSEDGICYANITEAWSGVINHDSQMGLFRYSNDTKIFPGLKMWTWGNESIYIDPEKTTDASRPYIELWGGHSLEFFSPSIIGSLESKAAKFYYFPTVELTNITALTPYGAVQLNTNWNNDNQLFLQARVFTTFPNSTFQVILGWINTGKETILLKTTFLSLANKSSVFQVTKSKTDVPNGSSLFTFYLQSLDGLNLLTANTTFSSL